MVRWDIVLQGIELAFTVQNLILLVVGFFLGVIVGILPGIGPAAGMALILPFSFNLNATSALILMSGVYLASNYGGSIAAILVNTPGESASAATLLDGYPMTQRGRAAEALGISATAGALGGMLGLIALVFTAPLLARLALHFGPPENALLALFALSVISTIVKRNPIKGLVSACIGLVFATVGMDMVSGDYRFVFGLDDLQDGVPFIQTMVGLFAIAQVIILAEYNRAISKVELAGSGLLAGVKTTFKHPFTLIRSFIIGLWIGALPAAGRSTASFMAYAEEVRQAKDKSQFGKGNPVGVIASEMANNSCAMGDLIPTLALGIPGSVGAAVFLGIMIIFGVVPGYKVFVDHGKTVYGLFTAFFIENLLILILGLTYAKYLAKITVIRNDIIVPMILVFSMLGSYSIRNSFFDLTLTSIFGIMGYFMAKYGYSPVPLVLALVLGPMLEKNFQRSMIIGEGSYGVFLQSGISIVLVVMTILSLFYPYLSVLFEKLKQEKNTAHTGESSMKKPDRENNNSKNL
jgi:putative tricarboxylic transport membrane protein